MKKKTFPWVILSVLLSTPFSLYSAPLSLNPTPIHQPNELTSANAWLEINTEQFRRNILQFKSHIRSSSQICIVMKADAYGNGIAGLMPIVLEQAFPCVAIASNGEAKAVREHGFTGRLMRVRSATQSEIETGLTLKIEELIGSHAQALALSQLAQRKQQPIAVHLALNDGGMGRNGIDMSTAIGKEEALAIAKESGIQIVGIMTHFPNYERDDILKKLARFKEHSRWLIEQASLKRENLILHVANSFTALSVPEAQLDMVRPGGVLYGDQPTHPEYLSIMTFKTRIASLHHLPAKSTIGYDSEFITAQDSLIANLPIGYSDGYPRKMGNKAYVLIEGQKAPVVGVSSMNTIMVDVSKINPISVNSEVILFGQQQAESINAAELESFSEVIFPELYTLWGAANPRIYLDK